METTTLPLEYAKTEPGFWQRRGGRALIIFAAVVVALTTLVVMNRRFLEAKQRLWDARRRYYETATETMAADHVVWDDRADGTKPRPILQTQRLVPSAQSSAVAVDLPGRWEMLWARDRWPVIFQHEMLTCSGKRVLVAVQLIATPGAPHLDATMLSPGTLQNAPLRYGPFTVLLDNSLIGGATPLKLYAGQPDPKDPHHFTIRYQTQTETGVLDGRMEEEPSATAYRDFGTIRLRRVPDANPPAAQQAK